MHGPATYRWTVVAWVYCALTVDPGFQEKNVAQVFLNLRTQGYDENHATAFMTHLRERIRGYPGVIEVAQAESAPLGHDFSVDRFTIPGRTNKSTSNTTMFRRIIFCSSAFRLCGVAALLLRKLAMRTGLS
jgi:hypothetical protein